LTPDTLTLSPCNNNHNLFRVSLRKGVSRGVGSKVNPFLSDVRSYDSIVGKSGYEVY
jgi:hypothetical protein